MMSWILAILVAVAMCYLFIIRTYKYWVNKGVQQCNPFYVFWDNLRTLMRKQSLADMGESAYNLFPNKRYSGFYQFFRPTLLLRDPELIKQITVRDFDHFVDHRSFISEDSDPLWAGNLFALNGQKWRDVRATLSPAFTSSKMKNMFYLISQSGEQFVNYFLKENKGVVVLEMKDTFTRFTNDVIANTAFGIECDSLQERNNEFYVMGRKATDFSGFWKTMKIFGYLMFPKLYGKITKISLLSEECTDFFKTLVKRTIENRVNFGVVRPDMIHLLLEARRNCLVNEETHSSKDTGFATVEESEFSRNQKTSKIELTDLLITSQALVFFFAGFDSVSTLMSFMSYELAVNFEVQQKLIEEVDQTRDSCNGKLTYEALVGMKYMDMVVSETLRKWPNAVVIDRICTKPYTIQPKYSYEKPVFLEKNALVWFHIFAVHRDPKNYPDPDRFDPERFSDENKEKIMPGTYFPFGSGPRSCIGSRFALLETKTLFFYILSHFEIVPVEKTQIPLEVNKKQFYLAADNGIWLGFKRR